MGVQSPQRLRPICTSAASFTSAFILSQATSATGFPAVIATERRERNMTKSDMPFDRRKASLNWVDMGRGPARMRFFDLSMVETGTLERLVPENGYHSRLSTHLYGYGIPWNVSRLIPAAYARPATSFISGSVRRVPLKRTVMKLSADVYLRPATCAADEASLRKSVEPSANKPSASGMSAIAYVSR